MKKTKYEEVTQDQLIKILTKRFEKGTEYTDKQKYIKDFFEGKVNNTLEDLTYLDWVLSKEANQGTLGLIPLIEVMWILECAGPKRREARKNAMDGFFKVLRRFAPEALEEYNNTFRKMPTKVRVTKQIWDKYIAGDTARVLYKGFSQCMKMASYVALKKNITSVFWTELLKEMSPTLLGYLIPRPENNLGLRFDIRVQEIKRKGSYIIMPVGMAVRGRLYAAILRRIDEIKHAPKLKQHEKAISVGVNIIKFTVLCYFLEKYKALVEFPEFGEFDITI